MLSVCGVPGCPTLTKQRMCREHGRAREQVRGTSTQRGYDYRWQKVRAGYLRTVGWRCESCGDRPFDTSKMHVHHRDRDPTGLRRFDRANLEALCQSCHNALPEHREPRA